MPAEIHPLLRKDAEPVEPVVEEPVAEDVTPEPTEPTPAPADPEPAAEVIEDFYRIPKTGAYKALEELANTDPEVKNYLNSLVGRKAKKEYAPKVSQLEIELAEARAELNQIRRASMDEDEIKERMLRDPAFARSFHEETIDVDSLRTKNQWASAIDQVFESVDGILPDQRQAEIRDYLAKGWFDYHRDDKGNPIRLPDGKLSETTPQEALVALQRSLFQEAQNIERMRATQVAPVAAKVVEPPAPEKEAPKPNLALAQGGPDLTPATTTGAKNTWKESEVKAMSRQEKMETFGWGEYDKAVKEGRIRFGE